MKKVNFFALGILMLTNFAASAFAGEVQGAIQSIDAAANQIVVQDNATGQDTTIVVHPKVIATLTVGETVKADLKPGSNVADTIEVSVS